MTVSLRVLPVALASVLLLAGCATPATSPSGTLGPSPSTSLIAASSCLDQMGGPLPPSGENYTGLQPVDLIFGGSLRHANTRVLLVPPTHGDLGSPTNASRSGMAYLAATLQGIFAWELAIKNFTAEYPEFGYLNNVSVQVDLFEGQVPATAGYDILIGYVETSGPVFRGVAVDPGLPTQKLLDDAGLGSLAHYGNRYVLLSLFAYSERAGQTQPDFPETPEIRGVTMHEFAHVWGLGHSTTFTTGCGADLMNSPYPSIYGDGNPLGDGGERTRPLCISSLDLYGLAHLYRWLPNGTWEGSAGETSLPPAMSYREYCDVFTQAGALADAFLARHAA